MPPFSKSAFFERIKYVPHSRGQWEYHNSTARFRIPVCGRRYGKSTMAGRDLEPELFDRGKVFWIVGPTYDLGEKEFRVIWDDLMIGQNFLKNKDIKRAYNKKQGEMYIEFPWGTSVTVRSATHPEGLVGEGLDGVIMSEAAKHSKNTWERFIRPALADKRGWATFPTTPEGFNWLYDEWRRGQHRQVPAYQSWTFPSWDNPKVYPGGREDEEIKLLEETLEPEVFKQEIGADFASFAGKIYDEFNETVHVRPINFVPNWPNYICFDWGHTHPFAAIEFQVAPDDTIYVWREHYERGLTLEDHIAVMKARPQPPGYHIKCGFGDAADPGAAEYMSAHFVGTYADPAAKSGPAVWRAGIDLVKRFLKERDTGLQDEYERPIAKPGLYVDPSCKNLIKEFHNYRTKENAKGIQANEVALRIDDHALDALRYGLYHLYELGAKHHLKEVVPSNTVDERLVAYNTEPEYAAAQAGRLSEVGSLIESEKGYFVTSEMVF